VFEVVEITPDRELDVAARDNLTAQDRVAITANTGCMVSRCHAGDVDLGAFPQLDNTVRLPSSLGYQTQAPEAVLVTSHSNHTLILCCGTYTGRVCVERRNSD